MEDKRERIMTESRVTCPVCDTLSRRLFTIRGYWFRECHSCQHRFVEMDANAHHIDQVFNDRYFTDGGAGYTDYLREAHLLRERGRWYGRVVQRHIPPGTVLDVGAAAGFILQGFMDCGWHGTGIEPNARMAQHARDVLGVRVMTDALHSFQSNEQYDLVSMIQVIAHFVDPRGAVHKARQLLTPGGALLIETWNCHSVTARLFGRQWHEYSPPSVLQCFSLTSLRRLTAQCDFQEIAHGRPSKWISGGHAKSLLRYMFGDAAWSKRLTDWIPEHWSVPYPAEDLFWILLKKG
jgi:2-polyprenyl-3-methyl-5-hydroxy-6-metoxy-1,4-benzoquinol methylase